MLTCCRRIDNVTNRHSSASATTAGLAYQLAQGVHTYASAPAAALRRGVVATFRERRAHNHEETAAGRQAGHFTAYSPPTVPWLAAQKAEAAATTSPSSGPTSIMRCYWVVMVTWVNRNGGGKRESVGVTLPHCARQLRLPHTFTHLLFCTACAPRCHPSLLHMLLPPLAAYAFNLAPPNHTTSPSHTLTPA